MSKRPKLVIKATYPEKITDLIAWVALVAFLSFAAYAYNVLPETIPTHFNAAGKVDATGGKGSFWLLPILGVFSFTLLTFLSRFPHMFNYMVEITEKNAEFQYRNAIQMIRVLKLAMVLLFFLISFVIYMIALGKMQGTGMSLIIIAVTLPVVPILFFIIRMKKGQ